MSVTRDSIRVLHVDDDADVADLTAAFLERQDDRLSVVTAPSAARGLDCLADGHVDCVVSDYDMPGKNGLEFLEAVRADNPDLPFILFTGKGSEEIASEAISAGVTDYLQKGGGDRYAVLANRIANYVEKHRAERDMELSFQAMETAREGISLLDEDGRFVYVNRAYADTFGYDQEEMLGEHWELIYREEDVDRVYEEILPAIPDAGRWADETVHVRKDGTTIVTEHSLAYTDEGVMICTVRDVTDEENTVGGVATPRDATEDRNRERSVQAQRDRFRAVFDEAFDAMLIADDEGRYVDANESACDLFGLSREELLGRSIVEFAPDDFDFEAAWEQFKASDRERGRFPLVRADGTRRTVEYAATPDILPGRHLSVLRDVTDRERVFESGYSTSDDGTGFGLAIVRQIAEAHDWRIEVTESETGGARIEITGVETTPDDRL